MDSHCFGLGLRTWIQQLTYHWFINALIAFSPFVLSGSLLIRYGLWIGGFLVPDWILP